MFTPLTSAIQKAKPIITKKSFKIEMEGLIISLEKREFIAALLEEYTHLLRVDINEEEDRRGVTIDTDFAGNESAEAAVFVIQDVQTSVEQEQLFAFIGFHPPTKASEVEEKDDELPLKIEKVITWDELKAWCEYVLISCEKLDEILTIEDTLKKEYEEEKQQEFEQTEQTSAEDVAIYPSSNVDYHAMWVVNTKDDIRIQIAFEDLHDIAYFIEHRFSSKKIIHSVYRDSLEGSIVLTWGKKKLKMTFIDGKKTGTVKLSPKKVEKLYKQINII